MTHELIASGSKRSVGAQLRSQLRELDLPRRIGSRLDTILEQIIWLSGSQMDEDTVTVSISFTFEEELSFSMNFELVPL